MKLKIIIFAGLILVNFFKIYSVKITLPQTTGKYPVGTKDLHLIDTSRKEKHNNNLTYRELMVTIFYPGIVIGENKNIYAKDVIEIIKKEISQENNISLENFNYLDQIVTNSYQNINISDQEINYPIILFSPGYSSSRLLYSSILEELASHGYFVVAVDHPYINHPIIFPDKIIKINNNINHDFDNEIETLTQDIFFIINKLQDLNLGKIVKNFKNRLNINKIFMLGHSLGGSVALKVCKGNPRCKAGINMDGDLFGLGCNAGFDKPFMFLISSKESCKDQQELEYWENGLNEIKNLCKKITKPNYIITLNNSNHSSFGDWNLITKPIEKNNLDPVITIKEIRKLILNFFKKFE